MVDFPYDWPEFFGVSKFVFSVVGWSVIISIFLSCWLGVVLSMILRWSILLGCVVF